jgi:3-oxoacid CoA-transferase A subunit
VINKMVATPAEAVGDISDGSTVMIGGFGEAGSPIELIHALIDHGATGLTVVNNNTGSGEVGLAALIKAGRVAKMICSYPRTANSTVAHSQNGFGQGGQAFLPSTRRHPLERPWQRGKSIVTSMGGCMSSSTGSPRILH